MNKPAETHALERQVAQLLFDGKTMPQVQAELGISRATLWRYRQSREFKQRWACLQAMHLGQQAPPEKQEVQAPPPELLKQLGEILTAENPTKAARSFVRNLALVHALRVYYDSLLPGAKPNKTQATLAQTLLDKLALLVPEEEKDLESAEIQFGIPVNVEGEELDLSESDHNRPDFQVPTEDKRTA
ncbi:MAG TPA: hypothetical protein VGP72_16570 [Planctomycetota bacterium]|jgi:hypothetical protein